MQPAPQVSVEEFEGGLEREGVPAVRNGKKWNRYVRTEQDERRFDKFETSLRFLGRESVGLPVGKMQWPRCDQDGEVRQVESGQQVGDRSAFAVDFSVGDEASAHASKNTLNGGGPDAWFDGGRRKSEQSAGGHAGHTDALPVHLGIGEHVIEQHTLMGEQQAVPAVAGQAEHLVEVKVTIGPGRHADVFHSVDEVAVVREERGASVLVAVRLIAELSDLSMPHEADDRRASAVGRSRRWFRFEAKGAAELFSGE